MSSQIRDALEDEGPLHGEVHSNYTPTPNGTAPDALAYDISQARAAVTAAIERVRMIGPNGRDYVGRDDDHLADLDAHRRMVRRLEDIEDELFQSSMRISDLID